MIEARDFINEANMLMKAINLKGWLNDWVNDHEGKVPHNFIPFEEFSQFVAPAVNAPTHYKEKLPQEEIDDLNLMVRFMLYMHVSYNLTKVDIQVDDIVRVELMKDSAYVVEDEDDDVLDEENLPITLTKVPMDVLKRIPYWSVRIPIFNVFDMFENEIKALPADRIDGIIDSTDDANVIFSELFVNRINVGGDDCAAFFIRALPRGGAKMVEHMRIVSLSASTLEEGLRRHAKLNKTLDFDKLGSAGDHLLRQFLPVVLYICSQQTQKEIGTSQHTGYSIKRKGKNYALKAAPRTKVIQYGQELRSQLETFHAQVKHERQFKGRVPHIRKAHWHGYWTGPRNGERNYIYHWIPPVLVSGTDDKGESA
ncbi:hypothetical protein AVA65_07900 [Salmonella enterica subsp. enterica serovar Minnesota]|nr:hypothetical protein [Salmonella enterica subsp. enterica serovar Minnesota]